MSTTTPPFPNPPLALTVLEIRYPPMDEEAVPEVHRKMRSVVRERMPLAEDLTEDHIQVSINSPAPASASQSVRRQTFPRFYARDRTTALVVKTDAMVLETTCYDGWGESFRPLIKLVVEALERICRPDGVSRIGLRYIDEIRVPSISDLPGDWRDYIDKHLLAAVDPDFLPGSLQPFTWQGLVQYQTTNDSTLSVRYGPQDGYAVDPEGLTRRNDPPAPGPFFRLDSDSFWSAGDVTPEFEAGWVIDRCDLLHAPTREFFAIAVTEKLRNEVFSKDGSNEQ